MGTSVSRSMFIGLESILTVECAVEVGARCFLRTATYRGYIKFPLDRKICEWPATGRAGVTRSVDLLLSPRLEKRSNILADKSQPPEHNF